MFVYPKPNPKAKSNFLKRVHKNILIKRVMSYDQFITETSIAEMASPNCPIPTSPRLHELFIWSKGGKFRGYFACHFSVVYMYLQFTQDLHTCTFHLFAKFQCKQLSNKMCVKFFCSCCEGNFAVFFDYLRFVF